jgi:hypothetical protein
MAEPSASIDSCARCGRPFHCGANDAEPCWCCAVTLDAATLAELNARYRGCLCRSCLEAASSGHRGSGSAGPLVSPL